MLVPPAYIAVTKSVGVSLLAVKRLILVVEAAIAIP
jgi:hypothetical protein